MKRSIDSFEITRDAKRLMYTQTHQQVVAAAPPTELFAHSEGMVLCGLPTVQEAVWSDGLDTTEDERDLEGEHFRVHEEWWLTYASQVASGAIVLEQGFGA
mmetsp:Transcript_62072/g.149371  ORF Transcript_62072/g.149371 Transcript_62072/m.149371 type:complete len:101 (-) Transcript_62072:298-600(-)